MSVELSPADVAVPEQRHPGAAYLSAICYQCAVQLLGRGPQLPPVAVLWRQDDIGKFAMTLSHADRRLPVHEMSKVSLSGGGSVFH